MVLYRRNAERWIGVSGTHRCHSFSCLQDTRIQYKRRAQMPGSAEDCAIHDGDDLPEQTVRYRNVVVVLALSRVDRRSPPPASCSARRSRRLPATSACSPQRPRVRTTNAARKVSRMRSGLVASGSVMGMAVVELGSSGSRLPIWSSAHSPGFHRLKSSPS